MANLIISLIATLSLLFSSTSQNIEQAFLQNSPRMLHSLFSTQSSVNISLPQPISFSDQLSNQQAYFLFRQILSSYTTSGFFSDQQPSSTSENSFIIQARWSFKDKKDKMYRFFVFFYFINESKETRNGIKKEWKISEIRAKSESY